MACARFSLVLLATVSLLAAASGCTRYREDEWSRAWPARVPASGLVTLDGQPVEGAYVAFATDRGGKAYVAMAVTDALGRFRLQTFRPQDGAVPGMHRVQIEKTTFSDPPADLPIEASFTPAETSHLPKKYRSTKTSGLTAEVTEDGPNEFVLELSTK
jgi:hypothetical protein